ncbi:hypothetical protein [Micromonospora sp. NPDC002717]|uniref:hypothetical protein n=1 Tax=Micromonospora sp. NPDC002717 TaxID=3154424 RepID=UPI003328781D
MAGADAVAALEQKDPARPGRRAPRPVLVARARQRLNGYLHTDPEDIVGVAMQLRLYDPTRAAHRGGGRQGGAGVQPGRRAPVLPGRRTVTAWQTLDLRTLT